MSLYRKYRPQTFADVVGQDHVVTTLEQAAEQGKLANAYLFAGSRGTGKTSVARILAKILMMQGIEDEALCRQIDRGVQEGTIVDLLEIDAASNTGVDNIRELIEKIQFSPIVSSAKVYIIDEVHMLSKGAFNALLKTLEEPPEYAYFILATTELHKVPETIRSRCQCFPFRKVREEEIVRRLQYIADQEHITADRDALRAISRHATGSFRDAISLLDQLRALKRITAKEVEERSGTSGQEHIAAILEAIEKGDAKELVERVCVLEDAGIPLDIVLRQLLEIVRESLHAAIEEKKPTMHLIHSLSSLLEAVRDVRIAPVPGLVVEATLLQLCKKGNENEGRIAEIVRKVTTKEEPKSEGKREEVAAEASMPKAATVHAPEVSLETVRENWPKILQETAPAPVKMSLKNGRPSSVEGTRIVLSFASAFHRDRVRATEASRAIEATMEKIFKKHLILDCVLEEEEHTEETPHAEAVNLAEAAAEIF